MAGVIMGKKNLALIHTLIFSPQVHWIRLSTVKPAACSLIPDYLISDAEEAMNWRELFDLRGINFWLLGAAVGLNGIWTFITMFFSFRMLSLSENAADSAQLTLMVSTFLGTFLVGWLTSRMADDGRGPTYGVVGSVGSLALIIFVLLPAGLLGLLVAGIALAGGLNGGLLGHRRRPRD